MNFIKLAMVAALMISTGYAQGDKKLLKPDEQTKKLKKPLWMTQDEFTVSTIDSKKVHLLSTKKGFTFDEGKGKITLLVVWDTNCKTCPKWLQDIGELEKTYPGKVKVYALEIGNTEKEKLEKLVKSKKADPKEIKKIIERNHANLREFAKKHNLNFPIISVLSNQGNLAFTMQTLYKFEFQKPRGKAKRGGGLPFTIVFGPEGQTAGITAGISDKKAYSEYIGKLIKHYEEKKQ